ncbi:MAG: 4-hydroxy-tetrahydrodipicolinate synthase [Marinicella sp.]
MRQIQAKDLTGSMVALVTPMHSDGSINYKQWKQLINWHIDCGTTALVVAGTTGESALLEASEIAELISSAVSLCQNSNTMVIVGTGAIDPNKVIAANASAQRLGADAVLVVTPYYLTLTQAALITHFTDIANQTDLPIILYNVPSRTGCDLNAKSTAILSKVKNIIGIKEAKADMQRIEQLVKINNFAVLSGDDHTFVKAMTLGAHGVISVAANVRPQAIKNMTVNLQLGSITEAEQQNTKLVTLYDLLFHEPNPCPAKALMHAANMIDNGIRKPLLLTTITTTVLNKHLKPIRQEFNQT